MNIVQHICITFVTADEKRFSSPSLLPKALGCFNHKLNIIPFFTDLFIFVFVFVFVFRFDFVGVTHIRSHFFSFGTGWYEDNWYEVNLEAENITCTREQMKMAAEGHLTTEALMWNQNVNEKTISGMSSGDFRYDQIQIQLLDSTIFITISSYLFARNDDEKTSYTSTNMHHTQPHSHRERQSESEEDICVLR